MESREIRILATARGNERQEATMDAEVFVAVISLAVIALITAGLFERRDASGADGI